MGLFYTKFRVNPLLKCSFWMLLIFSVVACNHKDRSPHGKVFRYNESKGITSLDPVYARTMPSIWPVSQLFCGLVQLDSKLYIQPLVAKSWRVSDNGLVYTFILRNDVTFHDNPCFKDGSGRQVVASDFVFSYRRLASPFVASPGSWVLSKVDTLNNGQPNVVALSDTTLVIRLKEPFPAFLGLLAVPYFAVVPQEAVTAYGKEFGRNPVGCGPFMLKTWRDGEKLVFVKNPRYFEKDSLGQSLPYLDAIAVNFITDKQSEFMAFILGNLDFISGVSKASKDELLTRTGSLNPKYSNRIMLLTGPYLNTEYLGFLVDAELSKGSPVLSREYRRAIAYGFDRQRMIAYLRNGLGFPAESGFIPMGLPPFSNSLKGFYYCPDSTLSILSRMGYSNGTGLPPITLTTTDDYLDICEFIQHELSKLGVKINVEVVTGASYRQSVADSRLPMFRGSWIADYADAESFLSLFYSGNHSPYGPNYTHFKNRKFDDLYAQSLKQVVLGDRLKLYRQMDSLVLAECPVIPLFYDKVVRFVRTGVVGMDPNPMNIPIFKYVDIK
ncbi:peptide/nickel transport system substrate-binding protein [Williamwhitmania taraxaci]|uniref:Peptide/nickel transport system substrate-binding protein n=2 Tax=Williamwhitmania taraxaci TaxID=1640674 RepID=A0A1G6GQC6_9BACT|nr:peptide/nickel transport system substrate-binding protein [Williamwhitmania taraxaci]